MYFLILLEIKCEMERWCFLLKENVVASLVFVLMLKIVQIVPKMKIDSV